MEEGDCFKRKEYQRHISYIYRKGEKERMA